MFAWLDENVHSLLKHCLIYINLKNGSKITHFFTNHQTILYLFCIFVQYSSPNRLHSHKFFVPLHPKASRAVILGWTRQPSERREQSQTCLSFAESRERKSVSSTEHSMSHGGQYDAEATLINFKNKTLCNSTFITFAMPCSDSRVSQHVQSAGSKPCVVIHARLSRPGSHRRIPASRHRYHSRNRWRDHIVCPSRQVRPAEQQISSHQLTQNKRCFCSLLLQGRRLSSDYCSLHFSAL